MTKRLEALESKFSIIEKQDSTKLLSVIEQMTLSNESLKEELKLMEAKMESIEKGIKYINILYTINSI